MYSSGARPHIGHHHPFAHLSLTLMRKTTSSFSLPQSLVPSGNTFSGSSSNRRAQGPHKIGYPNGWRTGDTEKWYKYQSTTKFAHLEYRKDREAPFYHEYIVAELDDRSVCRFDRRGDVATRAGAFTLEGMTADDTAHVIQPGESHYNKIYHNSDVVLRIHFPEKQDLITILGVCYGVQELEETRKYTLTRYNCYFLSWTILTVTSRRVVDWRLLAKDVDKWEALALAAVEGLQPNPSTPNLFDVHGRPSLRLGRNGAAGFALNPKPATPSFTRALIGTLRTILDEMRPSIEACLGKQLFQSTVESSLYELLGDSVQVAAGMAGRTYAAQVARDEAMEAVMEYMWGTALFLDNGGQSWRHACVATGEAVSDAATAAADSDKERRANRADWGPAWDDAWKQNWDKWMSDEHNLSNDSLGEKRHGISSRAKDAWGRAWVEVCRATREYTPLVIAGIVEHAKNNLPDSTPEILEIRTCTKISGKKFRKGLGSPTTNSQLQLHIHARILELCQLVKTVMVVQSPEEIEESMRRIWIIATEVLGSI
ncbi:hypothetical protein FRC10_001378 [Ceratobasidium sp. 414]|nr:hypothetical protein FRC10_001378 [Ceratobasidium sp. 414]